MISFYSERKIQGNVRDGQVARLENYTEVIERGALSHKETATNVAQVVGLEKLVLGVY